MTFGHRWAGQARIADLVGTIDRREVDETVHDLEGIQVEEQQPGLFMPAAEQGDTC